MLRNERTGSEIEVMIRGGELWIDTSYLPPGRRKELLESNQDIAVDPVDKIAYVRACHYGEIWPEHKPILNDLARKLGVALPWPQN